MNRKMRAQQLAGLREAKTPGNEVITELSLKQIAGGILFAPLAIVAGLAMVVGGPLAMAIGSFGLLGGGGGDSPWDMLKDKLAKRAVSKKYSDDDIAKMYDLLVKNSPQMLKRLKDNWGTDGPVLAKIASQEGISRSDWRKLSEILMRVRMYAKEQE